MIKNYCISKHVCFLLSFLLLFAFFAPASVFAGKFQIKPSVELQTRVDSNFYKSETNTKSVTTYVINPGVIVKYSTGKSIIDFNYDAKLKWEDGDSDDEHNAGLLFQTQATDLLQVSVSNNFMKTRDSASADTNSNDVDRYQYYLNTFSPQLKYKLSERFNLKVQYTNKITDYDDDEGEDAKENRLGLTLFYKMNPKTTLDMDYQCWKMDYAKTSVDYTSNQIMSNVNYRFNQFTLKAGAGYHSRKFDETVSFGDFGKFSWNMGLLGQSDSNEGEQPKSSIFLSLSQNFNDAGQGNSYFTSTGLNAKFTYLFTNRISGKLTGYIKNAEYETSDREDDRWLIAPAVDYLVNDKFTVGLETGYEERNSSDNGRSFDNEYGMIKVKYNYDIGSN